MFRLVEADQVTGPLKKSFLNHINELTLHVYTMKYFFPLKYSCHQPEKKIQIVGSVLIDKCSTLAKGAGCHCLYHSHWTSWALLCPTDLQKIYATGS